MRSCALLFLMSITWSIRVHPTQRYEVRWRVQLCWFLSVNLYHIIYIRIFLLPVMVFIPYLHFLFIFMLEPSGRHNTNVPAGNWINYYMHIQISFHLDWQRGFFGFFCTSGLNMSFNRKLVKRKGWWVIQCFLSKFGTSDYLWWIFYPWQITAFESIIRESVFLIIWLSLLWF